VRDVALMLEEFSRATNGDTLSEEAWLELRKKLLKEELKEVLDALDARDWFAVAKELSDLVYVVYGTAQRPGINMQLAIEAVHDSNMSKVGPDGKFVEREDGKVLKGEHYYEPDMRVAFTFGRALLA
jgi:predicted HAD superfamily Cof-like phosphohydrolase